MTIRELINDETNKIWKGYIENDILYTETGKIGGKMRKTEKAFVNDVVARGELRKKEWAKLKSGFVYRNDEAKAGQPLFHHCTRGQNQSYFPIARLGDQICCVANYTKATYVVICNNKGQEVKRIAIPQGTVYDLQASEKHGLLFLSRAKSFVSLNPETEEIQTIYTSAINYYVNIHVGEDRVAWGSAPEIGAWDIAKQTMIFQHTATKLSSGTGLPVGSVGLLENEQKMMICRAKGRIDIWDIEGQSIDKDIEGDFEYLNSPFFVDNKDDYAVFEHDYQLKFIDLKEAKICDEPLIDLPRKWDPLYYAFSSDKTRLAVSQWNKVYIYDWDKKECISEIGLEHYIKKAFVNFLDNDTLIVHTDYHCLSTYKIL